MKTLTCTLAILFSATACGGSDSGTAPDATETCTATFTWWQKDAYLDAPGRGSAFWPPHTTTTLSVTCSTPGGTPQPVASAEMVNHGTSIEDKDTNDTQILQAMRTETATGSRADLTALVTAYQGCECSTTFLSLDALSDSAVMDLVGELGTYLDTNMTCPAQAGGVSQLITDLTNGDIAEALTLAPMCTFNAGSWEEGLNNALAAVIAATQEVLADYHVCNNDALLQGVLWDQFATNGTVGTCNGAAAYCSSPAWYLACDESNRAGCLPAP